MRKLWELKTLQRKEFKDRLPDFRPYVFLTFLVCEGIRIQKKKSDI